MDKSKFSHTQTGSPHDDPSSRSLPQKLIQDLQGLVRKLIGKANLSKVPRKWWLVTALVVLAASSGLTMWQQHGPARLHGPLSEWNWFWHPLEINYSAALPQINRQLQAVALQPGSEKVWIAGEAGFVAFNKDSDGLSWSPLDYDASTGWFHASEGKRGSPQSQESPSAAQARRPRSFAFTVIPAAFAETKKQQPYSLSATRLSFSHLGQVQTVEIMSSDVVPAEVKLNIAGKDASSFTIGSNKCERVDPGGNCQISISFGAYAGKDYSAQLNIYISAKTGSVTLSVALVGGYPLVSNAANQSAPVNQTTVPKTSGEPSKAVAQTSEPAKTLSAQTAKSKGAPGPKVLARNTPGKSPASVAGPEKTAEPQWKPPARPGNVLVVHWKSRDAGVFFTQDGIIYSTTDAGKSWQPSQWFFPQAGDPGLTIGDKRLEPTSSGGHVAIRIAGTTGTLPMISIPKDSGQLRANAVALDSARVNGWAVAGATSLHGLLLRSSDGGRSWWAASHDAAEPALFDAYLRFPAPWYWLLALPLVFLAATAATLAPTVSAPLTESVSNVAISDRPLEPGELDAMNLNALAQGLSLFLRNQNTKPPLVLAVNGDWGTGKSSLMNLLQNDIRRRGARAIWFNAWHHQKEQQLLAALLQTVRTQAVPPWWTALGLWLRVQLLVKRARRVWPAIALLCAGAAFAISLSLQLHLTHVGLQWNYVAIWVEAYQAFLQTHQLPQWLKHAPLYTTILSILLGLNGVRKSASAFGANPASLLASLSGSTRISDLEKQTSFRDQFASEFCQVVQVLGSRRLLIIIDDLDRCRPEKVREVLEAVNFLVSSGDCFVVLGLARGIVEHCVGLSFRGIVDTMPAEMFGVTEDTNLEPGQKRRLFAERYLDKLIQVEVVLPRLTPDQASTVLGAEPVSDVLAEDLKRARQRRSLEQNIRSAMRWTGAWVVPVLACFIVGFVMWRTAPAAAPSVATHFQHIVEESTRGSQQSAAAAGNQQPVPGPAALSGSSAPSTAPPAPGSIAQLVQTVPPLTKDVEIGLPPQPESWKDIWLASLLALWILWFFYSTISRRADRVVQDSPKFREALDVWSAVVMSPMNTPRGAKRFLNRVRYLAMRQRALHEVGKASLIDRFCARVGMWLVADQKGGTHGAENVGSPAAAALRIGPRSLGAAAASLAASEAISESLLVALAAIQQIPGVQEIAGGWTRVLTDAKAIPAPYVKLFDNAVERHKRELGDWDQIGACVDAFRTLCSEVVAH
jgi:KAP family P-loop domain